MQDEDIGEKDLGHLNALEEVGDQMTTVQFHNDVKMEALDWWKSLKIGSSTKKGWKGPINPWFFSTY